MKILVIKTNKGLVPCYDSDYENYSKIPFDEPFEVEYTKKRNVKFHRKYFALLKLCFENQNDYRIFDELRRDLTIISGYYDQVVNKITGEVYKVPKSIQFSKMDNNEFNELYNATKEIISKWLGISNETLETELEQYF